MGYSWVYVLSAVVVFFLIAFFFRRSRTGRIGSEIAEERTGRKVQEGMTKARASFGDSLRDVFSRSGMDEGTWEALEEALIGADLGVATATTLVSRVRSARPVDERAARLEIRRGIGELLEGMGRDLKLDSKPSVVMVVGVNGTGKTTSIAKLARKLKSSGKSILLGAADTFRAAAETQLRVWAERVGVEVIGGGEKADPASVAFDAYSAAKARGYDVVIVDTAGRLHSKKDLMAELSKIRRVLEKEAGQVDEVLLVLDATAGQNGVSQAKAFCEAASLTGIILTKVDGTAKGGVVVRVEKELNVPVKFLGVGESMDDLEIFDPLLFAEALVED